MNSLLSIVLNSTSRLGILKFDSYDQSLRSYYVTLQSDQVSSAKNGNNAFEGHDSGQGGEGLDANGLLGECRSLLRRENLVLTSHH